MNVKNASPEKLLFYFVVFWKKRSSDIFHNIDIIFVDNLYENVMKSVKSRHNHCGTGHKSESIEMSGLRRIIIQEMKTTEGFGTINSASIWIIDSKKVCMHNQIPRIIESREMKITWEK